MDLTRWLQVRWKFRGRNADDGLDCLGLLIAVFREELGIDVPNTYHESVEERAFQECWEPIPLSGPFAEYNVLVVNGIRGLRHIGIVTRRGNVLTCVEPKGCVVQKIQEFVRPGLLEAYKCRRI